MSVANVLRLGYGIGGTVGSVLRLGYGSSVTPPVTSPTSVPGPSDGLDDQARKRWLEWRRTRQRRRMVERVGGSPAVQPTRVPAPLPIVEQPAPRVIDATPTFRLLAQNHAAMRAQREALERVERERLDEEDLIAMLLEDV